MEFKENIQDMIEPGVVTVFSKTYCPYCDQTKELLSKAFFLQIVYECDLGNFTDKLQNQLFKLSGIKTFPQNFIGTTVIGGNDSLQAAVKNGKAFKLFDENQIAYQKVSL